MNWRAAIGNPWIVRKLGRAYQGRAGEAIPAPRMRREARCAAPLSAGSPRGPLVDPHGHAWLELRRRADRIGAQEKVIDVVVADGARRPPYREFSERPELGDFGFEPVSGGRPERDLRTYRQTFET